MSGRPFDSAICPPCVWPHRATVKGPLADIKQARWRVHQHDSDCLAAPECVVSIGFAGRIVVHTTDADVTEGIRQSDVAIRQHLDAHTPQVRRDLCSVSPIVVIAEHRVAPKCCRDRGQPAHKITRVLGLKTDEIATKQQQIGFGLAQMHDRLVDDVLRCHRTCMEVGRERDSETASITERARHVDVVMVNRYIGGDPQPDSQASRPKRGRHCSLRDFRQVPPERIVTNRISPSLCLSTA